MGAQATDGCDRPTPHLRVVALLFQLSHRLHHHVAHAAVAEDGDIGALARNLGTLQALAVVGITSLTCRLVWRAGGSVEREHHGDEE